DCARGKASSTPRMPVTSGCLGKGRHLAMFGVDGARTMMLVYNLPATDAIYQRFAGIEGSAYLIGGLSHAHSGRRPENNCIASRVFDSALQFSSTVRAVCPTTAPLC